MNIRGRIAIERIPTPKRVSKIVVLRTLRKIPIVGHCVLDGVVTFLQDRAIPVEPADMVLVQLPLGVEDDIFVGGDVCLVGIGRAGAVLRRVPTGEVIIRAGEGVGGQGSCLIGLYGLRAHGSLAAVGVKGDDRIHRPLSIQGGILAEIHGRLVGIGRAGTVCLGIPADEGVVLTGKGVLWQIKTRIGLTCPGSHRSFAAVGVKVNSDVRSTAPDAVDIVNGVASLGGLRLIVGAVGVVQLGGGDGDGHRFIPVRIILIGRGFFARCTVLNIFAGSVAGADVCAALGSEDSTDSRQAAVYIHLGILQICIGAVIGFTGRIGNRLKLAGAPDKVIGVPFVAVINVDILAVGNRQVSALGNIHRNARQQCRVLVDGDLAGLNINRNIVGDG